MALAITHTTVAAGTDAGVGEIHKAEWNAAHTTSMATGKFLGRLTASTGVIEEIDLTAAGAALLDDAAATNQLTTLGLTANAKSLVTAADYAAMRALLDLESGVDFGYLNVPQNSQSTAYTTVLADQGKHILHPSADTTARIFTIDSNANVAYAVGTAITFVNQISGGVITISITSDTMWLAGAGTTGSRTLAANGVATALKITTTGWIISGTGLT